MTVKTGLKQPHVPAVKPGWPRRRFPRSRPAHRKEQRTRSARSAFLERQLGHAQILVLHGVSEITATIGTVSRNRKRATVFREYSATSRRCRSEILLTDDHSQDTGVCCENFEIHCVFMSFCNILNLPDSCASLHLT